MKKLLAIAALLLASSAAQAQYTFDYGGRTIRIDPDRGTVQIPGVYDNTPKAKRSRNEDGDRDRPRKQSPQQAKTDSRTPPDTVAPAAAVPAAPVPAEQAAVPPAPATVPAAPAPVAAAPAEPSTATVAVAPAADPVTVPAAPLPPRAPAPQVQQEPPPAPKPAPAVAAVTPPPAPPPAAPQAANSPLGVWLTEEKEGKVRIEQCGPNLCGYSVDKKSNRNGEQVLINMKPGKDNKWSGRIFDPSSGSTYDSTLALKGTDSLRVQGCAFGGMFCGGQTWTRVN
ncbi:DUF2147 domain-containing protein [Bradyrhizobium sp. AUGA SZCCT0240]|uniref:DUF2147 domain-containing protein n=1 Tax=unclassified Bradyrhizobium TaxID=2631580 RepID=UPI001BA877EE|nr:MULTISPECIES: DUF2147 domain-containing protein [unclassified Bradyrhizobium]MBR1196488.1 DUF2147 domain-containing protein [Bradyrhizobium sp. AUGA SZCCT0158]MBR1254706.1 DUF2147 domain-containing protein [Bradyrhizobium sp. AUGA SZCCT0240]